MTGKRGEFTVSWDEHHEYIISALIFEAENGDANAARELLGYAAQWLKDNKPLPENLRKYLSNALAGIAQGRCANRALKLTRKKDRFADWKEEHEITKAVRRERRKGAMVTNMPTGNDAVSLVRQQWNTARLRDTDHGIKQRRYLGWENAKKIYNKWNWVFELKKDQDKDGCLLVVNGVEVDAIDVDLDTLDKEDIDYDYAWTWAWPAMSLTYTFKNGAWVIEKGARNDNQ